jgi:hypothetical protein
MSSISSGVTLLIKIFTGKSCSLTDPITCIRIGNEIISQNLTLIVNGIPTKLILLPIIVIWLIKTSSKLMLSLNGRRNQGKRNYCQRRNEPLHERNPHILLFHHNIYYHKYQVKKKKPPALGAGGEFLDWGSLRLIGIGSDRSWSIAIKLDDSTAKPCGPDSGPSLKPTTPIPVGKLEDLSRLDWETPAIATQIGECNDLGRSPAIINNTNRGCG